MGQAVFQSAAKSGFVHLLFLCTKYICGITKNNHHTEQNSVANVFHLGRKSNHNPLQQMDREKIKQQLTNRFGAVPPATNHGRK